MTIPRLAALRQLHMAFNVAIRRVKGGYVPACDGESCEVCREVARSDAAEALAAVAPPPVDGIRFDEQSQTYVARYTILTQGRTEDEAKAALAGAVQLLAKAWPRSGLAEAEADADPLRAELEHLRKTKAEIWENPEKWMRWCDHRVLERAEAAERRAAALDEKMAWYQKRCDWYQQQLEKHAVPVRPVCTRDPNTCEVGFCDFPRCLLDADQNADGLPVQSSHGRENQPPESGAKQ